MPEDTSVLLLRFAGPLQSWGSASRFTRRATNQEPTKSGVIGLLAAAEGRRRTDPIEDLARLRIGIRVDRPGVLVTDFQTAIRREPIRGGGLKEVSMPLSTRHYLGDAVFLVAVEGPSALIEGLSQAVNNPRYPLSLGRRSCPPSGRIYHGLRGGTLEEALESAEWLGRPRRPHRGWQAPPQLHVVRDLAPGEGSERAEREHDVPLSFDPDHRAFGWRWVIRTSVPTPGVEDPGRQTHDPFAEVG